MMVQNGRTQNVQTYQIIKVKSQNDRFARLVFTSFGAQTASLSQDQLGHALDIKRRKKQVDIKISK